MSDFLLELRSEEVPARMQAGARADLERLFRKEMDAAGVALGEITVWSTPRRLTLIARDLPDATAAVSEELKGPRVGAPPQALEGFLRKTGLTADQLTKRDGVLYAVTDKPGRATKAVLAEAIPAIVRAFPWPKSMRWGAASISTESTRWVRPLSGIVALLGEELVECEAGGVQSGYATKGHRFHCPGEITIGSAADYQDKLRACHAIVDHVEREGLIRELSRAAALAEGLTLVEDEGLVIENAGLTEWPVPLLGRFDEAFLEVPPEVIQLTARTNQKYFVCTRSPAQAGASGGSAQTPEVPASAGTQELANAFVCTANIAAADGGAAIVAGNRKVLAARLSDARFFWEQDRKKTLAQHAEGLARITFHEKLGTVADKVERVAKLARWLVEEGIVHESPLPQAGGAGGGSVASDAQTGSDSPTPNPSRLREGELADLAEQAARLCKADLVTEMVGEFPELQGLMGGYYARAEGLPDTVADAIRDHYKPVGQGDEVPTAPVTVAVSLADKLDTLTIFFSEDMRPTGSRDPYALRRAALGLIEIVLRNRLRLSVSDAVRQGIKWLASTMIVASAASEPELFKLIQETQTHGNWQSIPDRMESLKAYGKTLGIDVTSRFSPIAVEGMAHSFEILGSGPKVAVDLLAFLADRLKVQQREAGVRHDLIDAVFALGGEDDLVRLLARVHALQAFVGTADGANLLAGYKRAANILKKEGFASPLPQAGGAGGGSVASDPHSGSDSPTPNPSRLREGDFSLSYTPEPAEKTLIDALDAAAPRATVAVAEERFADAMAALATLRSAVDAFFDGVTVNDPDPAKRDARLNLLARFRDAVHAVADFSKIEG